jgi:hypothetical protein
MPGADLDGARKCIVFGRIIAYLVDCIIFLRLRGRPHQARNGVAMIQSLCTLTVLAIFAATFGAFLLDVTSKIPRLAGSDRGETQIRRPPPDLSQ